jgi:hypothetical protein
VGSQVSDIIEGYTTLASSLLDRWSELTSRAATKADAGTYNAASATEDLLAGVTLATEAACEWASQWYKAIATVTGQDSTEMVESPPFSAPPGAALRLAGPLVKGPNMDQLPVSAISIEPAQLAPGATAFVLRADATGHRGATYFGKVNATTDEGTSEEPTPVTVWITVP